MRHFIIFERSYAHCVMRLVRASSLREAMMEEALRWQQAKELENGSIQMEDGYTDHGKVIFSHPLEFIESLWKADHWNGNSWEVQELWDQHWEAKSAQIFLSSDPDDNRGFIELCRPHFRADFPASRAEAFVWPLYDGALVTFHRRKQSRRRWPIEVLGRYLMSWKDWREIRPWYGTFDGILEQMLLKDSFYE